MHERILTYDLRNGTSSDYLDLLDLIDEYGGLQLTESTYYIKTDEALEIFKRKFYNVTKPGDSMVIITIFRDRKKDSHYLKLYRIR